MSQDNRYQFHMGCGEPLCSQWWQSALAAPMTRKVMVPRSRKPAAGSGKARGGRKA